MNSARSVVVAGKPRELQQLIDVGRIVLGIEIERVARLVGRRRAVEGEREMDGLLVRARRIQIDVLDDLGLDDIGIGRRRRLGAEIDFDDGRPRPVRLRAAPKP